MPRIGWYSRYDEPRTLVTNSIARGYVLKSTGGVGDCCKTAVVEGVREGT